MAGQSHAGDGWCGWPRACSVCGGKCRITLDWLAFHDRPDEGKTTTHMWCQPGMEWLKGAVA